MKLINSVCTNLYFPPSRKSIDEFKKTAEFLSGMGMDCMEFYHDGDGKALTGKVLQANGLTGVYIAVIPLKEGFIHLCDADEAARAKAVSIAIACIDEASANGITDVMVNSGMLGASVQAGLDALEKSVYQLFDYAAKKRIPLRLLMEPCDSGMDARQLIGPFSRSRAFLERVRKQALPLELTMDSAHTAEEGEDFLAAVKAVRPYCSHIHFANCNIVDKDSPFYGDKHIGYEFERSVWTPQTLAALFEGLKPLYPGADTLRIGLEVLCREQDEKRYFKSAWSSLPFLHSKQH